MVGKTNVHVGSVGLLLELTVIKLVIHAPIRSLRYM